jgi:hypothetical protein
MTLFNREKPLVEWKGTDSRFDAACSLAVALLEKEKGEILELQPLFQALIDELLKPVADTV